jgi:hypothetical protein
MKQHIAAAIGPLALGAIIMCCGALPAQALSMKECSALYKADQTAGKLNGLTWNAYRKEKCGPQATTTTTPDTKPTTTTKEPAAATKAKPATTTATNAVFPTALSAKYSKETPAKQRMHTCLDQYKANKANNANGGLVWIQKGGGYYSECNKHLKS